MFWDFWFGGFKQNSHPSLFQPNRKALCKFSMVKWPNSDILSEHTLSHKKPTLTFGTCSQLLQLSGSECVFSAEDRKVEQEQHLALVTESLQTWCSCSPPPPLLLWYSLLHASALQNWCNVQNNDIIIWLSSCAARKASNAQTVGEMTSTATHTSLWWRLHRRATLCSVTGRYFFFFNSSFYSFVFFFSSVSTSEWPKVESKKKKNP